MRSRVFETDMYICSRVLATASSRRHAVGCRCGGRPRSSASSSKADMRTRHASYEELCAAGKSEKQSAYFSKAHLSECHSDVLPHESLRRRIIDILLVYH